MYMCCSMKKNETRKRIEYFDLMKGVCIALVVISHCYEELEIRLSNEHLWSMLEHLRMPLYFFLSGMFFKEYSCFIDFVVRKFNKLIIPLLFFCVITVIPKLLIGQVDFDFIAVKKHISWMLKYGGYLWFLRTLFFANILYYTYNHFVKDRGIYIRIGVMLALTLSGWIINSFIPIEGDFRSDYAYIISIITSFLVLPFFFVASWMRKILGSGEIRIGKTAFALIFILSLSVSYLTSSGGVYLVNAKVENNIILFYIAAFSSILSVWCVCYTVKKLFYFSYIGRYSIIVYLTHIPLLNVLVYKGWCTDVYVLAAVTLAFMPVMIWIFKAVFPAFVAQRDILLYQDGRLKVDWRAFSLKNR